MQVWGTTPPVAFSFESTGHHSGVCLDEGCNALVYFGADNESDRRQYHLDDANLSGIASGTIDLAFAQQAAMGEDPNGPPWVPPSGTTLLQNVQIDASGNRLRFDFVSHLESPPTVAHYDLWRCE
jgi:hypothetical protein